MSDILCITIRFIQPFPLFHGRANAGTPEWPPSPMRAFQALLNAAASRHRGRPLDNSVSSVLSTLEAIRPEIIAPNAQPTSVGYRAYVPHNQADLVAAGWHRGNLDASIASHRMERDIHPIRIDSTKDAESIPAVHYLYRLDAGESGQQLLDSIRPCVRSITALGWGIDQVVGDATLLKHSDIDVLEGQVWRPASTGSQRLRVHRQGSLKALLTRHKQFLHRLADGNFSPVPPLAEMDVVPYRCTSDPAPRPYAVFKLIDANEDAYRHPHAKLIHVAGMVRHVAIERMKAVGAPAWIEDGTNWLETFVCGHRGNSEQHEQISYVPLPSIGHQHADAMIRNVMLIAPHGCDRELEHVAQRLNGEELTPESEVRTIGVEQSRQNSQRMFLERINPPRGKFIAECYLGTSNVWHSVTPVILDGHDDKKPEKTTKLIQTAVQRAGIETPCEFTWQAFPYLKNCLSAHKYDRNGRHTGYHRPAHLKHLTAVHVRLTFTHPVPGPITIGAGRHCGFGLMAREQR